MAALDPSEAYDALADLVCLLDHRWQGQASLTWRGRYFDERPDWPVLQRALYCEMRGRMTDRFLLKVDTSAMAHSLETRTPFLSRELFDCVRGLGRDVLLHGNTRKAVLRKIAEEYLPRDLIYRRKLGFTPPMGRWLLEPRYARILDWILGPRSPAAPWLDMDRLRCLGEAHRSAVQDHGEELFAILSFCLWWKLSVERTLAPSVPLSEVAVAA
jgi:asparagine synthase (glutamine-hydrolysing)